MSTPTFYLEPQKVYDAFFKIYKEDEVRSEKAPQKVPRAKQHISIIFNANEVKWIPYYLR